MKRSKVHAGGNKTWRWIEVRKCVNCGRNHRLIPDNQVPYKHYEGVLIEKVVDGTLSEDDMIEIENYPCDDTMNEKKYLISRYFKKGYNLYKRMTEDFDDYALFLRDLKVQSANNEVGRAGRKFKRKARR
ncbi:MAG: hypothetical protein IKO61_10495 [Lachnospiraceae bacterium]|nr:hypothetical protein [Lachnospiraceae bacterium]